MKAIVCSNCGAGEWKESIDSRTCVYCGTKYMIADNACWDKPRDAHENKISGISIYSDIERLLEKCKNEPAKARKYANLILDIDPVNEEALKYLR